MAAKPAASKPADKKAAAPAADTKTKAAAATETKEKPAPPPKDTQNGVTRPKSGTVTGKVWDTADKITKQNKGKHAARKAVMDALKPEGINEATIATQFGKWRRYNGLKGREAAE